MLVSCLAPKVEKMMEQEGRSLKIAGMGNAPRYEERRSVGCA
jgi:hypothetical protein